MTTPNGPDQPGTRTGPPAPEPPYNPRPGVPRSVILGGAGAVVAVIVVVILVMSLSGGGDENPNAGSEGAQSSTSSSAETPEFTPVLQEALFGDGWYDKATNKPVTPPQHITITDSVNLTADVESIGYGPIEQSMPKIAKHAETEASFPRNGPVKIDADKDGALRVYWSCETMYKKPEGADCSTTYNMTVDISGAEPRVVAKERDLVDYTTSSTSTRVDARALAVSNPEKLPPSPLGTDKATGATTVLMLSAVQPNESRSKVYFLVPDSLDLYVGELESSR